MDSTIGDRAARGAKLLDRLRPGWAGEVTLDGLAMETCDRCILGQVYGGYSRGCHSLVAKLPGTFLFSAAAHGFTLPDEEQSFTDCEGEAEVMARFQALADAWRAEVRAREGGA